VLAYITYFIIVTVIRFVQRAANLAAAGKLVVGLDGRLPARYTRRIEKCSDSFIHGVIFKDLSFIMVIFCQG